MPAIGAARAFDPLGNTIASIDAAADMTEFPMIYASVDTSSFRLSETYDVDGQAGWAIVKEMYELVSCLYPSC